MEQLPRPHRWLPSPAFLIFLGVVVMMLLLLIPGLHSSSLRTNEREAATMLKTIASAEADFRANDRDHNKVTDFWTGDVSGLYHVKLADGGPELRLIEVASADADAKPLFPQAKGIVAKSGYLCHALERYETIPGPGGEYKVDTDRSGRKVHNERMFGFCAYPVSDWYGQHIFMVNEGDCVFRDNRLHPRTSWPVDEPGPGPDYFKDDE